MLKREHTAAEMGNPCWKGLVSSGGLPCWVCTATGGFALDPPARLQDCRGGLFCDEPVSTFSSATEIVQNPEKAVFMINKLRKIYLDNLHGMF